MLIFQEMLIPGTYKRDENILKHGLHWADSQEIFFV